MREEEFEVVVSSGSLRPESHNGVEFPHRWTSDGVVAESDFTGAHLLHLSIAGCVLNDVHREASTLEVNVRGVRVTASGDFDRQTWQSTGVRYQVQIDSDSNETDLQTLIQTVDEVAEIPKALRAEATVTRT